MRPLVMALAASMALSACGDVLSGVGDLSREIVHGGEQPGTSIVEEPPAAGGGRGLAPITDLLWANDGIDAVTLNLERDALITAVWLRGDGVDPFVQSSRREIATALPGVYFPQLAPSGVSHITSQLLFDRLTGTLDAATAAAFGFWVGEPYQTPRSEGQLAILRVGLRTSASEAASEISSFQVTDGRELAWVDGEYVYQLFCRTGISEQECFGMADSMVPLSLVISLP